MKKPLIIDVRSVEEFSEFNRENSINIPVQEIAQSKFILELDKETHIQVYCHSGGRAEMAKQILDFMGFKNVENLGGVN